MLPKAFPVIQKRLAIVNTIASFTFPGIRIDQSKVMNELRETIVHCLFFFKPKPSMIGRHQFPEPILVSFCSPFLVLKMQYHRIIAGFSNWSDQFTELSLC